MYENILERMTSAAHALREQVPADVSQMTVTDRLAIDRAMTVLFKIIKEAETCLEFGTDPSLDIAAALFQARKQLRETEDQLTDARVELKQLRSDVQSKQRALDTASNEIVKLRKSLSAAETKVEELIKQNPMAAYDLYSTPPKR